MTQEELIKERQEKVASLLMMGHTEISIAKMLDVSRETIVRDVRELKNMSPQWLDSLAQHGFTLEFKMCLDLLKILRANLLDMLQNASSTSEKLKIIQAIENNIALYNQWMLDGPAVLIMDRKLNSTKLAPSNVDQHLGSTFHEQRTEKW